MTPDRGDRDGSAGPSGIQLESYIAQLIREKERESFLAHASGTIDSRFHDSCDPYPVF